MRDVVVLGSTGSVGTQTLTVLAGHPDEFRVVALAAGGSRPDLLARQVLDHRPATVALSRPSAVQDLQLALYGEAKRRGWSAGRTTLPRILAGPEAVAEVAGLPADVVLNAVTGSAGLTATLAALGSGATLALANKESLVVGGRLVVDAARPGQIVPVDSEHSAIAQCLRSGRPAEVDRLVLTASGGPFRGWSRDRMRDVTPAMALAHPTWDMGRVITTNSATLVNKAMELLEAHLLFDVPLERIDVVVHPQSLIHSMVQFVDGSTIAQCSPPDMALPIGLALAWPKRLPHVARPIDWSTASSWTFEPLDEQAFPAVELIRTCARRGGTLPAVYNAANEECVDAFHDGRIGFLDIVDTVAQVVTEHQTAGHETAGHEQGGSGPGWVADAALSVPDVLAADAWARRRARELAEEEPRPGRTAD